MRTILLFCLVLLITDLLFSQNRKVVLPGKTTYLKYNQVPQNTIEDHNPLSNHHNKTSAVSPILIGSSSSLYSFVRCEQNQVYACDSMGIVAFIHSQDYRDFSGNPADSAMLRVDISTDKGQTFSSDVGTSGSGPINSQYLNPAVFPMITGYNETGNLNPYNMKLIYSAPTLDSLGLHTDSTVNGNFEVGPTLSSVTENYGPAFPRSGIPGGLCQGRPGEFWTVEFDDSAGTSNGNIYVNKGTWNNGTSDVEWNRADTISPFHNMDLGGHWNGANISFSPDGNIGWIGFIGDLVGNTDSILHPVLIKSTDGGNTWGMPVEVDLNQWSWVADSLQALWTDSSGNPLSNGIATTAFDFDLIVDNSGNPHFFTVIGTGFNYAFVPELAKYAVNIYSTDQGSTWKMNQISPVLAFRGMHGGLIMDNHNQVARNPKGDLIFFAWVDSDTCTVTGNASGIGFGNSINSKPNLRIASMTNNGNCQTYPQIVNDLDAVWYDKALFPSMSNEVLYDINFIIYNLPIVIPSLSNDKADSTTKYFYFGNDTGFTLDQYCPDSVLNLSWENFGYLGSNAFCWWYQNCGLVSIDQEINDLKRIDIHPNPFTDHFNIEFDLQKSSNISFQIFDQQGRMVHQSNYINYPNGRQQISLGEEITGKMPAGIYIINIQSNNNFYRHKIIKLH